MLLADLLKEPTLDEVVELVKKDFPGWEWGVQQSVGDSAAILTSPDFKQGVLQMQGEMPKSANVGTQIIAHGKTEVDALRKVYGRATKQKGMLA